MRQVVYLAVCGKLQWDALRNMPCHGMG